MRVLLTSTRGAGHVRPLLPFAEKLSELDHDVLIAAPDDVQPIVAKAGFRFRPFDKLEDETVKKIWADFDILSQDALAKVAVGKLFSNLTARAAIPKLEDIIIDCKPDIIVRESVEFAGFILAEKYAIPHARVSVHNGRMENVVCEHGQGSVNAILREQGASHVAELCLWQEQAYTAFPAVFDGDAHHPNAQRPFRVDVLRGQSVPGTDWLPRTDRSTVYITFGTVVGGASFDFREMFQIAIDSIRDLDVEVIMTTGPNIETSDFDDVPENLVIRQFVPQRAVLEHAQAVVFHGGSGTLTGALAAGVPMVVVPLFADQPMNAERVRATGLGKSVFDRTPDAIRAALVEVLESQSYSDRAQSAAKEIASLPDLLDASRHIESLVA